MSIEFLRFHPVKKTGSLIGFASFKFNGEFSFTEVGVHLLRSPKPNRKIRLLYPEQACPANSKTQLAIDEEISAYISANYKHTLQKD